MAQAPCPLFSGVLPPFAVHPTEPTSSGAGPSTLEALTPVSREQAFDSIPQDVRKYFDYQAVGTSDEPSTPTRVLCHLSGQAPILMCPMWLSKHKVSLICSTCMP